MISLTQPPFKTKHRSSVVLVMPVDSLKELTRRTNKVLFPNLPSLDKDYNQVCFRSGAAEMFYDYEGTESHKDGTMVLLGDLRINK